MAKSFSDAEKKQIREALLDAGKQMFSRFGLKKTTVDELTDAVGIAKGSFYNFFESKETLYYEIFLREEKKLRGKSLMLLSSTALSPESFKRFLVQTMQSIESNPIIRWMYLTDEYQALTRKLPQEYLDAHTSGDIAALIPLIRKWQAAGQMQSADPEIITSVIRSLFMLVLHKKEIGEEYYDETIELLAESIAQRLFAGKDDTDD